MDATSSHSSQFSGKSVIWNFYNKHGSCDAVCKTCFKSLKTPTGSTTSLIRHLEKHSNELNLYKKLKEEYSTRTPSQKRKINDNFKQTTLGEAFQKPAKFPRDHARAKEITMCIGKMMATDFQPYTIVEDYGFKQLCETMEPRYNLPSATTFSRSVIPALFDEQSKILKDELVTDIEGSIFSLTFTTDMWTSRSGEGYISLTSHYITNNFQLKKHVLSISHFPGNHTGEAISSKLTELLHTWGLAEVTVPIYVVSDNARNIVNAVSLSGYEHIQCFAHSLQLAISDAKKGLGIIDLLASARNIVTYYSHSNVARERLHSKQKQGGFPVHELIQMVDTRWNSEYLMLSRLLEQKQPVMADLVENGRDGLSAKDWKMAEGMVQVLQPIYEATKEMCVDKLPTLPMVIPVLIGIDSVLKKHIDASGAGSAVLFAKQLKQCVWSRFPEYKKNKVYRTAMMLDPRFKAVLLDKYEKDLGMHEISKEALEMKSCNMQPSQSVTNESKSSIATSSSDSSNIWSVFEEMKGQQSTTPEVQSIERDLQIRTFFREGTIPRSENPLAWWCQNESKFHLLAPVAKKYLGIPATQVASERLFSSAGNTVTSKRENLLPQHVEQLIFLHERLLPNQSC